MLMRFVQASTDYFSHAAVGKGEAEPLPPRCRGGVNSPHLPACGCVQLAKYPIGRRRRYSGGFTTGKGDRRNQRESRQTPFSLCARPGYPLGPRQPI